MVFSSAERGLVMCIRWWFVSSISVAHKERLFTPLKILELDVWRQIWTELLVSVVKQHW